MHFISEDGVSCEAYEMACFRTACNRPYDYLKIATASFLHWPPGARPMSASLQQCKAAGPPLAKTLQAKIRVRISKIGVGIPTSEIHIPERKNSWLGEEWSIRTDCLGQWWNPHHPWLLRKHQENVLLKVIDLSWDKQINYVILRSLFSDSGSMNSRLLSLLLLSTIFLKQWHHKIVTLGNDSCCRTKNMKTVPPLWLHTFICNCTGNMYKVTNTVVSPKRRHERESEESK